MRVLDKGSSSEERLDGRDLAHLSGEGVALGNTAHVHASLDLEEALVTPAGAPRVLNDPVVHARLVSAEANSQHGVVHVLRLVLAGVRDVDAGGVVTEAVDNLEGDGDGAVAVHGRAHLLLVTLGDVDGAAGHLEGKGGRVNGAGSILSIVGIGGLSGDTTSSGNILKGVRRQATIAPVVIVVTSAINQLLLSKRVEAAVLDKRVSLEASNSGESPARSAVTLILDRRDTVVVTPIPGGGKVSDLGNRLATGS